MAVEVPNFAFEVPSSVFEGLSCGVGVSSFAIAGLGWVDECWQNESQLSTLSDRRSGFDVESCRNL
jgi:hypothetical protein